MFTSLFLRSALGRRWWYSLSALGLILLGASQPPISPPPPGQPAVPQPAARSAVATNGAPISSPQALAAQASPMDEPLRLIHEAQKAYQNVRDYTCLLIKRERINGRLSPDHVIEMKVRTQPFSVYLRWLQPRTEAGQEVCYVAGRNDGKMRVRPKGVFGDRKSVV